MLLVLLPTIGTGVLFCDSVLFIFGLGVLNFGALSVADRAYISGAWTFALSCEEPGLCPITVPYETVDAKLCNDAAEAPAGAPDIAFNPACRPKALRTSILGDRTDSASLKADVRARGDSRECIEVEEEFTDKYDGDEGGRVREEEGGVIGDGVVEMRAPGG